MISNIRNNNNQILQLLPETTIRFGWANGAANPSDLTSKLFLTPTKILNSAFHRHGPIEYLKSDSYGHVFIQVIRECEQYSPPPNELGVVSNEQCTICKLSEMCLVFVANVT